MRPATSRVTLSRRDLLVRALAVVGGAAAAVHVGACSALNPFATATAGAQTPTSKPSGGPGGPGGNEDAAATEPFVGITTNGTVVQGLFPVFATGVSTEPVRKAADAFLAALTDDQRATTVFAIDDAEWRKWSNVDSYRRQGVRLEQLSEAQRTAAFDLMGAALSAKGLQLSRDIMRLNTTQGELMNRLDGFNEWLYYVTVMGTPSATEPWGFQVDGHHLVINYFVLGDQVVMSPVFMGSEPPVATTGTYAGLSVLQNEQNYGLALINAIPEAQRSKAIIEVSKTGNNNVAEAFKDNVVLDYAGLPVGDLAEGLQTQLLDLVAEYVDNMDDGHAQVRMDEVRTHLAKTYFAWIGATDANAVFYYRVHSPVILIEFDHPSPGPAGNALGSRGPSRNHIHTVVRTPNGNDYGKDLLRQHYEQQPHA
jgi:hypothetical protein